jgi:hypothetical protein
VVPPAPPSEPGVGGKLVSLGKWAWLATRMKPLVKAPQGAPSAEGGAWRSNSAPPAGGEGELLMAVGLMVERVWVGVGMVVWGEHGRAGLLVVAG